MNIKQQAKRVKTHLDVVQSWTNEIVPRTNKFYAYNKEKNILLTSQYLWEMQSIFLNNTDYNIDEFEIGEIIKYIKPTSIQIISTNKYNDKLINVVEDINDLVKIITNNDNQILEIKYNYDNNKQ